MGIGGGVSTYLRERMAFRIAFRPLPATPPPPKATPPASSPPSAAKPSPLATVTSAWAPPSAAEQALAFSTFMFKSCKGKGRAKQKKKNVDISFGLFCCCCHLVALLCCLGTHASTAM